MIVAASERVGGTSPLTSAAARSRGRRIGILACYAGFGDRKYRTSFSSAQRRVTPGGHIMTPREREAFSPVTLGQIRGHGCRNLLVYCGSLWCNHSAVMNADWVPVEMPVRSLCPRMVCTACGLIGADVRPDWSPHTNRRPS